MGFGKFGADGQPGGLALGKTLDRIAGIEEQIRTDEQVERHLRYLTRSTAGYRAMRDSGIALDPRKLIGWLSQTRVPCTDQRTRIHHAYRTLRRRNMAPSLTRRLNAGGGTRIEIHPTDQSGVESRHRRERPVRRINIRRWDPIIQHWAERDLKSLTHHWQETATALGSDWRTYEYVSHVGFWA